MPLLYQRSPKRKLYSLGLSFSEKGTTYYVTKDMKEKATTAIADYGIGEKARIIFTLYDLVTLLGYRAEPVQTIEKFVNNNAIKEKWWDDKEEKTKNESYIEEDVVPFKKRSELKASKYDMFGIQLAQKIIEGKINFSSYFIEENGRERSTNKAELQKILLNLAKPQSPKAQANKVVQLKKKEKSRPAEKEKLLAASYEENFEDEMIQETLEKRVKNLESDFKELMKNPKTNTDKLKDLNTLAKNIKYNTINSPEKDKNLETKVENIMKTVSNTLNQEKPKKRILEPLKSFLKK